MTADDDIERLAKQLWGEASWVSGPHVFRGDDPGLQGTWCVSAHASTPDEPPIGISVNYLPSKEVADAVIKAALRAAIKATHGMATCGPVSVDADGREVSHGGR